MTYGRFDDEEERLVRAVVQRVTQASVTVDGVVVARLPLTSGAARAATSATTVADAGGRDGGETVADGHRAHAQGLVVLVAAGHDDDAASADALATRVWRLRILDDQRSASDVGAPILVVSQFTLLGDTRRSRRPSWSAAAPRDVAEPLVDRVVATLRALGADVHTGVFGADMAVALVNDGPVTVLVDV